MFKSTLTSGVMVNYQEKAQYNQNYTVVTIHIALDTMRATIETQFTHDWLVLL